MGLGYKMKHRLAIRIGLAAGAFAVVLSLVIPEHFQSEAALLMTSPKVSTPGVGNLAAAGAVAAAMGITLPTQDGSESSMIAIVQSRWMAERMLESEFEYPTRWWKFATPKKVKRTLFDYLSAKDMDDGVEKLAKLISVSSDKKKQILTIRFESRAPELSKLGLQRLLSLLEEFVLHKIATRGNDKAQFSEARLQDARREMDKAEREFLGFLNANRNYLASADPSIRLRGSRLESELALHRQVVATLTLAKEQAVLEARNDMPILNVLDPANLPSRKNWPPRMLIIGGLLAVGALLGWGWENQAELIQKMKG